MWKSIAVLAALAVFPGVGTTKGASGVVQDAASQAGGTAVVLTVSGVPERAPFRLRATATAAQLVVQVELEAGWYLNHDPSGGEVVSIETTKGSSFGAAGALQVPRAEKGKLYGKLEFVLPLKRTQKGGRLRAELSGMVCDALQCLPPMQISLQGEGVGEARTPLRVLVVTPPNEERSTRIREFLAGHGVQASFTTYEKVTDEACAAADVVVADSPNPDKMTWRNVARLRNAARKLPRTDAPIVAVGFLGTELVEGHGLAMTSGYI